MDPDDPDMLAALAYMAVVMTIFALLSWYIVTTNPSAFATDPALLRGL